MGGPAKGPRTDQPDGVDPYLLSTPKGDWEGIFLLELRNVTWTPDGSFLLDWAISGAFKNTKWEGIEDAPSALNRVASHETRSAHFFRRLAACGSTVLQGPDRRFKVFDLDDLIGTCVAVRLTPLADGTYIQDLANPGDKTALIDLAAEQ